MIYDNLSTIDNVFLQDRNDRELARIKWMSADSGIFLSVAFTEGLESEGAGLSDEHHSKGSF